MLPAIQLGVLAIFSAVFLAALSMALAKTAVGIRWLLLPMALLGLIVARLVHVVEAWDVYVKDPVSILCVDELGWLPAAVIAPAILYALYWVVRKPEQRRMVVSVVLATSAVWLAGTAAIYAAPRQSDLPKLTLRALDGRMVDLQALTGKPVVLNVWATWCSPCRKEMPVLHAAQQKYRDVTFVFLNAGETPERISEYLEEQKLSLSIVLLDTHLEAKDVMGNRGLPTTIFYGADGRMVSTRVGELTQADLEARLSQLGSIAGRISAGPREVPPLAVSSK